MIPALSQNSRYLIDVLRAVLEGTKAPLPYEGVDLGGLFKAADVHKLAPMVYHGLYGCGIDEAGLELFREAHRRNMILSVKQEMEAKRLSELFDKAGMDHCFLKGCHTRKLYPDPSMRSMSDIDVLVRRGCREKAKELLESGGYECIHYDISDDDKYKRGGVCVEIHDGLDADGLKNSSYYDDPWRLTVHVSGHEYRLAPVHEYLYAAAHAMKHFMNSGAGLRFLVDIRLYMTKSAADRGEIERCAREMGIDKFLHCMEKTASAAFSDGDFDEDSALVFMFMLENGIGGSSVTNEASKSIRTVGGKSRVSRGQYHMRRLFPSLTQMKRRDPILKRAPILLPFMYVRRWFQLLFSRRERLKAKLSTASEVDKEQLEKLCRIYEIAGVSK